MPSTAAISAKAHRCQRKFLYYFKNGFRDQTYLDWERSYKEDAHKAWNQSLHEKKFKTLLAAEDYHNIAKTALSIESKTNLLFSFEKMAIRDAVKSVEGAEIFSKCLFRLIYDQGGLENRFNQFVKGLSLLPRIQTRVVTWPVATVFGFIANPEEHIFLKPMVTRRAAEAYGFPFKYSSKVNWETYRNYIQFATQIQQDLKSWRPKDMIDIQSFIWVLGSDEYPW